MTPFTPPQEYAMRGAIPAAATRSHDQVVELHLLLPLWQVEALEATAQSHGMTTGQVLRRVIADMVRPVAAGR